jgi:hypothetical protein
MSIAKRFHLLLRALPIVAALVLLKAGIHAAKIEFVPLDGLIPSLIAGAIFLIGFLLSQVLANYREAEHMPAEIRTALEAIHDDVTIFAQATPSVDGAAHTHALADIVVAFETGLGVAAGHRHLEATIDKIDALSPMFARLQALEMPAQYVVRLKTAQDTLRRCVFRVAYMQKMQFSPSVHVLVQTLVLANLFVLLFLKTANAWEAVLILILVGYMFVYSLLLIQQLDQPFREGEASVDDVSIYQLRDFVAKIGGPANDPI